MQTWFRLAWRMKRTELAGLGAATLVVSIALLW
jgi:hypothetical protein